MQSPVPLIFIGTTSNVASRLLPGAFNNVLPTPAAIVNRPVVVYAFNEALAGIATGLIRPIELPITLPLALGNTPLTLLTGEKTKSI